jgi:serine/threonine protein kinase
MSVRTALGFQRIEVAGGLPQPLSADFPLDALANAKVTLCRTPVPVQPSEVRLDALLGSGAYGAAYCCTVFDVPLVVKVPLGVPVVGDHLPTRARIDEYARDDFAQELRNAERLLEPLNYRGARRIQPSDARALHAEMLQMRAHRGYDHVHRLIHGELSTGAYPMLFSEPCDGTLWEKRRARSAPLWTTDAPEWQALARQLLSAFDYTRTRGLYHLDIKPDNVFYIGSRYMLADFGRMSSSEMMHRSARMLVDTLLVSLGDNLRYEYTRTVPDPPFDAPLQQIAQRTGSVTYERYKRGYKRKFGYFSLKNTQPSSLSLLYLSYVRK